MKRKPAFALLLSAFSVFAFAFILHTCTAPAVRAGASVLPPSSFTPAIPQTWLWRTAPQSSLGTGVAGGARVLTGQTYAPDQADRGAAVFAAHCEVCHGDVGQGLDKWRLTWDDAHQNCSNYKCHGKDYPPGGFYLPNNYAPALIGDHTLDRFQTARDLYAFISSRMPYQEPGTLSAEDYWALAAFLMRGHGIAPKGKSLDAANANSVPIHPTSPPAPLNPAGIGLVALVPTALGVLVFRHRRR